VTIGGTQDRRENADHPEAGGPPREDPRLQAESAMNKGRYGNHDLDKTA